MTRKGDTVRRDRVVPLIATQMFGERRIEMKRLADLAFNGLRALRVCLT